MTLNIPSKRIDQRLDLSLNGSSQCILKEGIYEDKISKTIPPHLLEFASLSDALIGPLALLM